ncbi:MAG: hypothetical protein P8Y00_11845 [Deltaproteobacteria bacterium]|jgi:hypothetical protein
MSGEEYRKISVLDNEVEARLIESILNEREIPHMLRSYHDTAYDGLFQTQKGWGELRAPKAYEEEILAILKEVRETAAHS